MNPTITITSPSNGTTLDDPVTVTASLNDPDGRALREYIKVSQNGQVLYTCNSTDLTWYILLVEGTYDIQAFVQYDTNIGTEATASSAIITITISGPHALAYADSIAYVLPSPTLKITNPEHGGTIPVGSHTITWNVVPGADHYLVIGTLEDAPAWTAGDGNVGPYQVYSQYFYRMITTTTDTSIDVSVPVSSSQPYESGYYFIIVPIGGGGAAIQPGMVDWWYVSQ
jgi:hypothetical protein